MSDSVTPTDLGEVVTAGDEYVITITLSKDGVAPDVTGGTVTASIFYGDREILADVSLALTTPASGIVTLTLTEAQTAQLATPPAHRPLETRKHLADVKAVVSGVTTHYGPFKMLVRRALT